ncbi:MAG: caspase family protein [Deltaproteobacteria bacterium]|nr:MAG: caspase family protein [Deltaproteobacteria bacterium]
MPVMWRLFCLGFGTIIFLMSSHVSARDLRLALLVANETGWGQEARLRGALRGDLEPMSRILKQKLGFQVVVVRNGSAAQVRRTFAKIRQRLQRKPKIRTFLFYYSGHADKQFFHLRQTRRDSPLSYQEFVRFFLSLKAKRRFALLDACDSSMVIPQAALQTSNQQSGLMVKGPQSHPLRVMYRVLQRRRPGWKTQPKVTRKGATVSGYGRSKVDLKTLPPVSEKQSSGLQIIASNGNAYHNNRLGASVFTRHFLFGLRGAADRNQDGKITMDELYDYAKVKARKESGQRMDRLVFFRGTYNFAPNYRSSLVVPAQITGKLFVSVGDFAFAYHKTKRRIIQIPMVDGQGLLRIQTQKRCWLQPLRLPRSRRLWVNKYGRQVPCQRWLSQYAQKGDEQVLLPAEGIPYRPSSPNHVAGLSVGATELGSYPLRAYHFHLSMSYRWRDIVGVGLEYEVGQPPVSFQVHRLFVSIEPAWPVRLAGPVWLLLGGYLRLGTALASTELGMTSTFTLGGGGMLALNVWLNDRWGLRLGGRVGVDATPLEDGKLFSLHWGLSLAPILRF